MVSKGSRSTGGDQAEEKDFLNARFIRSVTLDRDEVKDFACYPFTIPAVRKMGTLDLDCGVTFLAGDNGSGKSTLIEAIAVAAGFNAEGGSRNFNFATRASHSELHGALRLVRSYRRPKTEFFLRAESFFNVATQVDELDRIQHLLGYYGGKSLHDQSHGESFLALVMNRFGPDGLYVLDEPEAALSVRGCLALLRRMSDLVKRRCQFVVSTHSPILMGYPGARIYQLDQEGIRPVRYEETEAYQLTRAFLDSPGSFFRRLFEGEEGS